VRDFSLAALGLFAAVAPLGGLPVFLAFAKGSTARQRLTAAALIAVACFALMAAAAAIAGPLLDWLEVSGENFQLAAAAVMLPLAARLLWSGRSLSLPPDDRPPLMRAWLMPLTLPLIAGPTPFVTAMSYGARFDAGLAMGAAALIAAVTGALLAAPVFPRRGGAAVALDVLGRFNGALLAVVAVELFVDGIQSV